MQNLNQNTLKYSFLGILSGSDLSRRRLPCMRITSREPGPVVWLTGCMHGDEIGGTVIIHEVFRKLKTELRRGAVHAFPLINPFGFEAASRNISLSQEDLNRSFPGKPQGSLAERIAAIIFSTIVETKPDLVLDLHNDWIQSIPYVLIDTLHPNREPVEKSLRLAEKTGLICIADTELLTSTLTYNLLSRGIPALTLELGESYTVNEENIQTGFQVVWNILRELEMVEAKFFPVVYKVPAEYRERILKYSPYPYSSRSGILRFLKHPGDIVRKGQKIAQIYNAFGKRIEIIKALHDSIILGKTDYALSFPGAPVMAFGIPPGPGAR